MDAVVVLLGFLGGIVAGLLPGIHQNTIAQLLTNISADEISLSIAIAIAASISTVLSFIPSVFLFIPEQSTFISVLPGQKLVREGKGQIAMNACAIATLLTILLFIPVAPISFFLLPKIYDFIRPFLAPILTILCFYLIAQEKEKSNIIFALVIFLLSGLFGTILLNSTILREPLFSSFIGLFALSNLLLTMKKIRIPKQKKEKFEITKMTSAFLPVIVIGIFLGIVSDLFPAINSPAIMATFGLFIVNSPIAFLALTVAISVSHLANSFIALATIKKARIGATAIISQIAGTPNFQMLVIYLVVVILSIFLSVFLLLLFSRLLTKFLHKINLGILNLVIFIYLIFAILFVDGLQGIFVAAIATSIGILPLKLGVRRIHLMGFLLLPTLLYLWV